MLEAFSSSERKRVWLASAGFMCVASAALIGRTAGDTLFLDRFGAETLAYMYIGTAAIVGGFSYALGTLAARFHLSRVIVVATAVLGSLAILVRLMVPLDFRVLGIVAFYVGDLMVFVPVLVFWSFATELFQPREAKRLFGYIGASGTAACIVAGLLVAPFASRFSPADLFVVAAILLVGFALAAMRLEHSIYHAHPSTSAQRRARPSLRGLWRSRQTRNLALIVFLATVALTLVDFQFKTGAKAIWQGQGLASFFGVFYGLGNAIALLIQLFLVHRIMRHGGLLVGLRTLPTALILTTMVAALTRTFGGVVASKFMVQTLAFTVDLAALQVLYMGVARPSRKHTRAVVDGVLKPAAIAFAGVGALAVSGAVLVAADRFATVPVLSGVAALASVGWLLMTGRNHADYVDALSNSLTSGRLDFSGETTQLMGRETREFLERSIEQADGQALEALTHLAISLPELNLCSTYSGLLARPSVNAQRMALTYLAEHGDDNTAMLARSLISSADSEVRRGAVRVVGLHSESSAEVLRPALEDPDPFVRAEAAVHLASRYQDTAALAAIDHMRTDPDVSTRVAVASVIGTMPSSVASGRISDLLGDTAAAVRNQALMSVRDRPLAEHLEPVVALLADPESAGNAEEAIIAFGARAVSPVSDLLSVVVARDTEGLGRVSRRLPRLLAALPGGRHGLIELLARSRNPDFRFVVVQALRTRVREPLDEPDRAVLLGELEREVYEVEIQHSLHQDLEGVEGATVLQLAARESAERHRDTALEIVAVLADVSCDLLHEGLGCSDPSRRSAVLELIDNALDRKRRHAVMNLFEEGPIRSPAPDAPEPAVPGTEIGLRSAWHAAGLVELYRVRSDSRALPWIMEQVTHPNPVVRELSLRAVERLGQAADLTLAVQETWDDPHPSVRSVARGLAPSGNRHSSSSPGGRVS